MAAYSIKTYIDAHEATLVVAGEIDVASSDQITALGLLALQADSVRRLVVDLDEVTFLDSTGIGALVRLRNRALADDVELVLRRPRERVRKMIEIVGLDTVFTIESNEPPSGGNRARVDGARKADQISPRSENDPPGRVPGRS